MGGSQGHQRLCEWNTVFKWEMETNCLCDGSICCGRNFEWSSHVPRLASLKFRYCFLSQSFFSNFKNRSDLDLSTCIPAHITNQRDLHNSLNKHPLFNKHLPWISSPFLSHFHKSRNTRKTCFYCYFISNFLASTAFHMLVEFLYVLICAINFCPVAALT